MLSTSQDGAPTTAQLEPVRQVVRAIADLVGLVEPRLLALWKATGMTLGQRRLLRELRDGPRAAGSLATSLGVAAPTLTRHLARLEARGLIARTPDRIDRRRVLVTLTATGRRALADHGVFRGGPVVAAARELTSDERIELVSRLNRFATLARGHVDRGAADD